MKARALLLPLLATAVTLDAVAASTAAAQQQNQPKRAALKSAQDQTAKPASPTAGSQIATPEIRPLEYVCNSGNCAGE